MDHLKRVTEEFTRQADTFDAYAPKADIDVGKRFGEALGEAARGKILDLACGPGVLAAALAGAANAVVAFDATPAMLEKARARCAAAGLENVSFEQGNAESLPFEDEVFDAVVMRLALHHFESPTRVLTDIARVLRPNGGLVIAEVVVSDDPIEASLQNAIENLRDPSHVRMLPADELDRLVERAGFTVAETSTWDKERDFEEWMGIANEPLRAQSLRVIARALAEEGRTAGMGLSIEDDDIVFFHRWRLISATRH